MPQFDITSFYPQITFFAVIFLMFYVFLTKNILPKISQNLKLNKRIADIYTTFAIKKLKDLGLLSYIYQPSKIISYLIYKETISLLHLNKFLHIITIAFASSLNWLSITQKNDSKVRLFKLNTIYLNALNDIFSGTSASKKTV